MLEGGVDRAPTASERNTPGSDVGTQFFNGNKVPVREHRTMEVIEYIRDTRK